MRFIAGQRTEWKRGKLKRVVVPVSVITKMSILPRAFRERDAKVAAPYSFTV